MVSVMPDRGDGSAEGRLAELRARLRRGVERGVEPGPDVGGLTRELDHIGDADLDALGARELGDLVAGLQQAEAAVAGLRAKVVAAWDARSGWAVDDALSASAWLRWRSRLPSGVATREVARARALRDMPATAEAFADGRINARHVGVLMSAREAAPEAFAHDESTLVGWATDPEAPWFHWFAQKVRAWRFRNDAEGAEVDAEAQHAARRCHASETFEGVGVVDAVLPPVEFAIFKGELDRLEHRLWEADWADARARLGDDARPHDLRRTGAQRRADALVEMAVRSAAMPADAKRGRVLVTVLCGYETLKGPILELANRAALAPGQLIPWLTETDIERAVFDSDSRVIDLGRRSRLFTGAARRALELSGDRSCATECCDIESIHCECDHYPQAWADGGQTDQDNGRPKCCGHHPGRRRRPEPSPPPRDDGTDDQPPDERPDD